MSTTDARPAECYDCGNTATATTTEASTAEHDLVCAACADYVLAAGYPVFPLAGKGVEP